jgi:hypothetical protein
MLLSELIAHAEDARASVNGGDMEVVIAVVDSSEPRTAYFDVIAATKKGETFQVFTDDENERGRG